jgi:hypothetical protein
MTYEEASHLPIVIGIACSAGQWSRDNVKNIVDGNANGQPSFGEAILKSKAAGIAYIGSGIITPGGRMSFHYDKGEVRFVRHVYFGEMGYLLLKSYHDGAHTLGELTRNATFQFVANNEMDYWLNRYSLFIGALLGDPALKIPKHPRFSSN